MLADSSGPFGGGFALMLAPLAFLLAFKYALGTSFLGAIGLAVVALLRRWSTFLARVFGWRTP